MSSSPSMADVADRESDVKDSAIIEDNDLARTSTVDSVYRAESDFEDLNAESKPVKPLLHYDPSPWYARVPFLSGDYPLPRASLDEAPLIPEASASFLSLLTFQWMTPILSLGYYRPLEPTDLYRLQDTRSAEVIADKIVLSFRRRQENADAYNQRLAKGEISPGWRRIWWAVKGDGAERERRWTEKDGRREPSLILAINDSVKWWFWSAGILKVIADTSQILSPLLAQAIINFATDSFNARNSVPPQKSPPIGKGIGLAFALLVLQLLCSLTTHHFFYRSMSSGVLLRAGLITAIYERSLRLSNRARTSLTNGKLVNHISTDVSRIDFCCSWFHMAWTGPIQMLICLVLLLINLGPSALAGFFFCVIMTPLQARAMKNLFKIRQKSMVWTDKRAKLLQELLGAIKIIKLFAWEIPLLERISDYRKKEVSHVRSLILIRAANNAVAASLPILAAVLTFVIYAVTGHKLEPAAIFTSLTLFQLLRLPLGFMPMAFSAISDAASASKRLQDVFVAELLDGAHPTDPKLDAAVKLESASFSWDASLSSGDKPSAMDKDISEKRSHADVFQLKDTNMVIPRGKLCGIVGPVGSGKSSLLQGIVGEMRKIGGKVTLGGTVGYCAQIPWIQNATIRDNICFGRPFDKAKYWKVIKDACLERDLELLPQGDLTEVGEKGVSLSGGQKQRVNIARAIYSDADIQIFDDPLSALDAHVGRSVFKDVMQEPRGGKTRIVVTHALHFLPSMDHLFVMMDGRIVERGTYEELMAQNGPFARFFREFGSKEPDTQKESTKAVTSEVTKKSGKQGGTAQMMQTEERVTGAVGGKVYGAYFSAGEGNIVVPSLLLSLVLMQGSAVMSTYWLVYWLEDKFAFAQGVYMAIYAALGFTQAVCFFWMGSMFAFLTYFASQKLHWRALIRLMQAPMSFFETTPVGRIMNRFSKDIDTIDNLLGEALRMFTSTLAQVVGAVVLISILLPYFLVAIAVVAVLYYYAAVYYRSSARELKRLDAILRSSLYAHFSESLSGLATIRAYDEVGRFEKDNKRLVDIENRAYLLTVANQRWLSIRIDILGVLLTLIVAILTVVRRTSISPAQTGVTLSFILFVQQSFGWLIRLSAEVENNMNSVERIVHYADSIEQEAPHESRDVKKPKDWPAQGRVELKDVELKYRPELPPVLKGLTMTVKGGEKIGIVGRTGAGKTSIMVALYRLVELSGGSICIDGIDVSKLGLTDLRSSISIIPQEPLLFSGTMRTNLDPFGLHDDARLWDALRRSYLVSDSKHSHSSSASSTIDEKPSVGQHAPVNQLTLDSPIEDEGNNLSVGQRSLVSLARALVKDSKILVLDEATASVDFETDRNIQDTIAREFHGRTILCIAHRLHTIIGYDRICVMDAGQIAELDTPSNLFQKENGIFRGMCDQSSITWEDIQLAAKAVATS